MKLLGSCIALVVLALVAWYWQEASPAPALVPEVQVESRRGSSQGPGPGPRPGGREALADEAPASVVAAATRSHTSVPQGHVVLVTDHAGLPLEGVTVSWSLLESPVLRRLGWTATQWEEKVQASTVDKTDSDGRVVFAELLQGADERRSVIWATLPGYAPTFVGLAAGVPLGVVNVQLDRASSLSVFVEDASGLGVPGARVLEVGLSTEEAQGLRNGPSASEPGSGPVSCEEARLAFVREVQTGADGWADLAGATSGMLLLAEQGERRSLPAAPSALVRELTLRLAEGHAVASGRVTMSDGSPVPGGLRVVCRWLPGTLTELVGEYAVGGDGAWGPAELPRFAEGRLRFDLAGGDAFALPVERPMPALGEELVVDLEAQMGITQAVRVFDEEDGHGIAGARVMIAWPEQDFWPFARALTGSDGRAHVRGCKGMTSASVTVFASGYRERTLKSVGMPHADDIEVGLARSASLKGRVMHAGDPVEDFEIAVWDWGPHRASISPFRNRRDGTFELDDVPAGEIRIMASSTTHAESRVVQVDAVVGEQVEVELELEAGVGGHGKVVDAFTGEPVGGARVTRQVTVAGYAVTGRGASTPVEADGSFSLSALGSTEAMILVEAPGYVTAYYDGSPGVRGGMDFGTIPLAKYQTLRVELDGEPPFATKGWWFTAEGAMPIPYVMMPGEGVLEVPDVAPGFYQLDLVYTDGTTIYCKMDFVAGDEWVVRMPFGEAKSLDVQVLADGQDLSEMALAATYRGAGGTTFGRWEYPPSDGLVHLTDLHGDPVSLVLTGAGGNCVAKTLVDLTGPGPHFVELTARPLDLTIQLVGGEGYDLAKGNLRVGIVGSTSRAMTPIATRGDGSALFVSPERGPLLIMYSHPDLGVQFEVMDFKPSGEQTLELVLKDLPKTTFEVRDGSQPVSGANWALGLFGGPERLRSGIVSDSGRSAVTALTPSKYVVRLGKAGYWTVTHELEIAGDALIPLQLRRRGKLRLSLRSSAGQAISGATFALYSTEFNTTAAEWRAQKRLAADAVQLTTDAQGKAQVVGIPHGEYQWSVRLGDGSLRSGVTVVPAGEWGALEVLVGN